MNITEADLRKVLDEGLVKNQPRVNQMTHLMMDMYQQGFNDCLKLLTGNVESV